MKGITVVFTRQQLRELGSDKIAAYMRNDQNTALCGDGEARHMVHFSNWATLRKYAANLSKEFLNQ